MYWSVVVAALLGCGRVSFDLSADAAAHDARCAFGPFSPPERLTGPVQSSGDDWVPTPAAGGTLLFFYSFRMPSLGADLWFATRPDVTSQFSAPTRVVELATAQNEIVPTLTEDSLLLAYANDARLGDLVVSTRNSITDPWSAQQPLVEVNTNDMEHAPWLSADGLRLLFVSSRPGTLGMLDLYETSRSSRTVPFATPVQLVELESVVDETTPTLSADGLEIFFISRRTGGIGGADVYTARRPALDQPFSAPEVVRELCTPFDEYGVRLSADGQTMYLNYDTLTAGGRDADLWTATRGCM